MTRILVKSSGDPPTDRAVLTVLDFGPNKAEAAEAILELCEQPRRFLVNVEVAPPFRMQLPQGAYSPEHPLIRALAATGCRFAVTCWPWLCPEEMRSDQHSCRPSCAVTKVEETFCVPERRPSRILH